MKQILFFDGVCNLCNGFIDFIMKRDREDLFLYSPLQGKKAKSTLPAQKIDALNTVVLWSQGEIFEKSDAALLVLQQLGGIWWLSKALWIFPKPLRDLAYDLMAKNRYKIFGKKDSCRLPTKEERAKFLD